jgi:uncharacterized protein involved in type VI secretion and phage assembly
MAGPGRGFYCLPEIDDEVLVAFEHGDIRRPYVLGALWNGKDRPVEGNSSAVRGGKVNRRSFKTRVGHTILLDDTDGKGQISLTTNDGRVMVLDDQKQEITVQDRAGNKLTLQTGSNSITLECTGNMSLSAGGTVSIKGAAGVTIQGATVNIN